MIEKQKMGWLGNLRWNLWFRWVMLQSRRLDAKHKRMRRKYCRKGFHKVRNSFISHKKGDERTQTVRFIRCQYCNYLFFAKRSDKEKYLRLTAKENSAWRKLLSSAKPKRF